MPAKTALQSISTIDQAINAQRNLLSALKQKKQRKGFAGICELLGVGRGSRLRVIERTRNGVARHAIYTIHERKKGGATLKIETPVWGSAMQEYVDFDALQRGFYDGETYFKMEPVAEDEPTPAPLTWTRCDITPEMEAASKLGVATGRKPRTYAWAEIEEGKLLRFTGKMGLCRHDNYSEGEERIREYFPTIGRIHWVSTCEYEVYFPGVTIAE